MIQMLVQEKFDVCKERENCRSRFLEYARRNLNAVNVVHEQSVGLR